MSRKKNPGRRIEAAADNLAESVPEKVGPLIHSAADLVESAADRVGPLAQSAADRVAPLAQSAAERVAPLAQAAAGRVQPYAQSAYETVSDRVSPLAQQAAGLIEPYAHQAADAVGPYAKQARKRGAHLAHDAVERFGPKLDDALDRVTPAIEYARDRVQGEWLPKLADRLSEAADGAANSPAAVEAQRRSRAAAAALRGELILPEDEPKKKSRWVLRLAVITAIGGAAFYLLRRFLAGGESDWQAARPTPYTSTTITEPTQSASEGSGPASPETAPNTSDAPNPASVVASHDSVFEVAPDADAVSSPRPAHAADEPADESTQDVASVEPENEELVEGGESPERTAYGEHAFIGAEPPMGFFIKANERSKKYHLPDMAGYQRTNTEVWFDSEEAAEAAGFTKAQR